ncbi:uncharacterized protein V3H82_013046 [Fundulus diaphanus]
MEGPGPDENPDNEYMAMDPDQWEEQDDTYEDLPGLDVNGRREVVPVPGGAPVAANPAGPQLSQTRNSQEPPRLPTTDRYMTIRWPPANGNRGLDKSKQLGLFRKIMVGLVLLCLLLLGILVGLSIAYDVLAGMHLTTTEQTRKLQEKNYELQKENEMNKGCRTKYHISSTGNLDGLSTKELYVLNHDVLQEFVSNSSFFLHYTSRSNASCYDEYSWNCTC